MTVLVFKTDIHSVDQVDQISPLFNTHPYITDWSVDTEDIDKVLRIESIDLLEQDVIQLIQNKGFLCEALAD